MFYWYKCLIIGEFTILWISVQIKHPFYPFSAIVPTWDNSGTGILDNVCSSQPYSCLPANQLLMKMYMIWKCKWKIGCNQKNISNLLQNLTTFLCCRHLLANWSSLSLRYPPNKMDKSYDNDGNDGEIILSCWFLLNDETWRKHDRGSKWQRQNGDRLQFLPIGDV